MDRDADRFASATLEGSAVRSTRCQYRMGDCGLPSERQVQGRLEHP
jgi:hypothetical protein